MGTRFSFLITVIVGAYAALVFRLYILQVQNGEAYVKSAEAQAETGVTLADRAIIYFTDKNGKTLPVATSKEFPYAYATPRIVDDPLELANEIAPELGLDIPGTVKKLTKKGSGDDYAFLERKIDPQTAEKLDTPEMQKRGIFIREAPERFYPFGPLAAHLLGFVSQGKTPDSMTGKYGVERQYDKELSGTDGKIESGVITPPTPGESLQLTLDPNLQMEAERLISAAADKHQATGGSVIIEEPKTGKILAMASVPNFDPNEYAKSEVKNFLNPVVQEIYEPGSVFKVITMAAGIDSGKITPNTTFNDTGVLMVSGKKIQNWDLQAHGLMTMTNVIEKSLNTGAAFAERQTGNAIFKKYVDLFGFGDKTGIDLPGELRGDLRRLTPKAPQVAYATASFGQGVAVTPMEMLNAVAAIANGGKLMRPYLNAKLGPQEVRRVISPETARQVAAMMVSAVDKAEVAHIDGYTFAGKTGTAQVPDFERGGYSKDVIHTYIGFGPTADPRFIILLKLNKPVGAPLAGATVVPLFRDLAQFLVNYYNIPPDRPGH